MQEVGKSCTAVRIKLLVPRCARVVDFSCSLLVALLDSLIRWAGNSQAWLLRSVHGLYGATAMSPPPTGATKEV